MSLFLEISWMSWLFFTIFLVRGLEINNLRNIPAFHDINYEILIVFIKIKMRIY